MGPRCLHAVLVLGTILAGGQRPQETPPRVTGWSPGPLSSWVPTPEPGASSGDPEGSAAALVFLQTGDTQRLARANCSQGVVVGAPGAGAPLALRAALHAAAEALAHAANFLNMLFQTNDIREASVAEDVEWYQALVRSLVEGHPWVRRAVLALDAHPLAAKPRLMLQATKGDGEILLQDISAAAPSLGNLSWDNEWFNALKSQRTPLLRKRLLSNDLRSMETPKWQRGDSYVGDPDHVRWSPPFLECRDGKFLPAWAVTLSSAFYGLKPDLSPEFKGVVRLDVELRDVAIDQCASGPGWFADTHRCDLNSTQCVPQESHDFVLGRYLCRCKPGFYRAGGAASSAWAGGCRARGGAWLACRPCRRGCATCEDDAPCLIQEDRALRAAVLSCQACCMLAVFLSMLVSYHFRQSKRIRASGVVLLETILFGSLLLYFPVFILYFKPSIFRCIVLRWVRMLGFAIVYGTITLKLYRVLKVFLSRTAQRVPYVSSGRVLKMLGLILLLVLWFLAAWTIGMLENIDKNIPLVIRTQTARGLHFYICGHDRWDYMMVIAEMLFLLWGSFLCYATRAVPSAFHEPRYMGIALHNELMISATFHVVRFIMVPSLHPDWTLLLFFAHTHGTITMTLALLFIPKFLHAGSPLREEIAAEVYEDELDMRCSGSCLNSSIASAWSERSLDPDDIREELKKLYAQLEVHKTRRMATNNPHLPKKRSSRRSLGRSIMRHIAELPEARRSGGRERGGHHPGASRLLGQAVPRSRREPGPGRKTTAATALEQSDSESLDAAPLVCKSASAHNLAGHGQPPRPCAAPLQKSLSVVTGAREEALLAASRAARDPSGHPTSHRPPKEARKPQSLGAADALAPAGARPTEGGSQEDTSPLGDGKVQKHVTYAPIKSISTDSSHLRGRVRMAVRRTPPPPPVRYHSLGHSAAPARHSLEPVEAPADLPEPPTDPPAWAGEPERTAEGSAEEDSGRTSPPARKGRLLAAASIPAQVCPWELVQEEILSRKQKATEAADSGTPHEAAAAPPSLKLPSQKTSLRNLGLAVKAFNRVRGKSILKAKSEGEGSLRKRGCEREGGSRRERPSLAKTAAVSLGGVGQDPTTKRPEWRRQRPGSESPAHPEQGDAVPGQHNAGWGDGGAGQRDSPAPGTSSAPTSPPPACRERPPRNRGAAVRPRGAPGVPAGRGALLRQGAVSSREDTGVPPSEESPATALEKGGSQPEPLGPGENQDTERVSPRSRSAETAPVAAGKAGRAVGRQAELCSGETQADSSIKTEICPQEESGGEHWGQGRAPGKGGSEEDPGRPREELGAEKPRAKTPELLQGTGEKAESVEDRRAEVCLWDTGEGGRTLRAEICPWDGERRGSLRPREGAEQPSRGLAAKLPALPRASSKQAGTTDSKKADISPWEVGHAPLAKTEICPWEEPATTSGKERPSQDKCGTSKGENKPGSRGPEDIKANLPPEKPCSGSPALPKSPSSKSQSAESLKAEVCPWEAQELESTNKAEICPWEADVDSSDKAEICLWEVAAPLLEKGAAAGKASLPPKKVGASNPADQGSSGHKAICSWESPGMEELSLKAATGKEPSKKSDICPWEVAEPTILAKESGKPGVHPLGADGASPTTPGKSKVAAGASPVSATALLKESKGGSDCKAEHKPLCRILPGTEPSWGPRAEPQGASTAPAAGSGPNPSATVAEVCPWEAEKAPPASDKTSTDPRKTSEVQSSSCVSKCTYRK
ncbi:unnamed protein product [Bubo scandiacus]